MALKDSRLLAALVVLVAGAAGCSPPRGEMTVTLGGPPSAVHLFSHGIALGWFLTFEAVLVEAGGVDVALQGMALSAVDQGTGQEFGPSIYERTTLEQEGWTTLHAGERLRLPLQIGRVPDAPRGPITVRVEVRGTDRDGNPVAARLDADYPLAAGPP